MRLHGLQRFLAATLVLAMIPLAWWTITQGGPYSRAERFLHGHPAIESRIGRITSIRLAFRNYSFAPADDTAHLELLVTGERGNGFATVDLHWERGAWDVVSVKFRRDGETVPVQTFPVEKPHRREMMWVASLARSRALRPRTA
jgi:hypothetical protein